MFIILGVCAITAVGVEANNGKIIRTAIVSDRSILSFFKDVTS